MFPSLVARIQANWRFGSTIRGKRFDLLSVTGAKTVPAQADIYADSKGRFYSEPVEYQIACFLAVGQIGE